MAPGAGRAGELDVSARVDGQAVVLVLDVGTLDANPSRLADVESVL